MAWVTIANVRGPRGLKGDAGDPLNAAGWQYMKDNFDAIDGSDIRTPWNGGRGTLHSHPDLNGRETWLAARESDGGPTDWAETHLRERLGVSKVPDGSPYLIGFTDSAYRYTDLVVRATDGQVPDWVIDRWAARISHSGNSSGGGLRASDRYVNSDGDLVPAFPDIANTTGWGSSTMQAAGPFFEDQFAQSAVSYHNEGKSAERSEQIAARMGALPALLTVVGGSIPASGAVEVTSTNIPTNAALKPYEGTLNGVHGTLSSDTSAITFTRTSAGSATAVSPGTPFIPDTGVASRDHVTILNIGKNNFWTAGASTKVIADTNACFDYLSPLVKRCVIIGHFVDSDQLVGSVQYNNVLAANVAYADRYGNLYFDLRSYLASPQLWSDTGISPTATDLQQQADGIKPDSVSQDSGHLNTDGNQAVTAAVYAHMKNILGWY